MASDSLVTRVEMLEHQFRSLNTLPDDLLLLRDRLTNVGDRLANVEGRLANVEGRLTKLGQQIVQLRAEMHDGFSALRHEIRTGDEETRTFMRVLHEEVLSRIAAIGER